MSKFFSGRSFPLLATKSQDRRCAATLLEALSDNDEEIQIAALQGLSAIGTTEATNDIMSLAHQIDPDRNPDLYEAAIRAIASIGYNSVVKDALRSDDEIMIRDCAEACQLMDDRAPLEEIKNLFWRVGRI